MIRPTPAALRAIAPLLLAALFLPATADPALAATPAGERTPRQRERVVELGRRVQALAAVEPVSVESLAAALGARLGPPVQLHAHRRERPVLPSELFDGGLIIEAGPNLMVEVRPAPGLQLAFEDVAAVLVKLPYSMETRSSHLDAHSLATRIHAIDHVFHLKGGQLRVQVLTTVAADAPDHDRKAQAEGHDSMLGLNSRLARVEHILFTTAGKRLATGPWPGAASLEQRRKRKRP